MHKAHGALPRWPPGRLPHRSRTPSGRCFFRRAGRLVSAPRLCSLIRWHKAPNPPAESVQLTDLTVELDRCLRIKNDSPSVATLLKAKALIALLVHEVREPDRRWVTTCLPSICQIADKVSRLGIVS